MLASPYLATALYFYPRPPRGGRPETLPMPTSELDFYPRPPRGGRLGSFCWTVPIPMISIHALREEGDRHLRGWKLSWEISIHALREEGDRDIPLVPLIDDDFYPRPPRGGRRPNACG